MDYRCLFEERCGNPLDLSELRNSRDLRDLTKHHDEVSHAVLALLDHAASCLEGDEIYVEVGRASGLTTIAALAENPDVMAYVIDDPRTRLGGRSGLNASSAQRLEVLSRAFETWGIADRVWLLPSSIEEFFSELRQMDSSDQIGLFVYCGPCDYRSILVSLLMVEPHLAPRAAIVVSGTDPAELQQAITDFLAIRVAGCRFDLTILNYDLPPNIHLLRWDCQAGLSHVPLDATPSDQTDRGENASVEPVEPVESVKPSVKPSEPIVPKVDDPALWVRSQPQKPQERQEQKLSVMYNEARAYHAEKRLDRAQLAYHSILKCNAQHVGAQLHLGLLYYEQGRYNLAIDALWQTLNLDADNTEAYYGLGLTYTALGEPTHAIAAYHQALERNAKHFNALNNLGNLYYEFDCLERSADLFEQAIAAQPKQAGGYLNRARIELERHNLSAAIDWCKQGLKHCPPQTRSLAEAPTDSGWGDLLHNIDLVKNYQLEPSPLYRQLAAYASRKAQPRRALRHYRRLYEHRPTSAYARSLVNCYRTLNQYDDADQIISEALNHAPQDVGLHQLGVQTSLDLGQFEQARTRSQQAIAACPNSASLQLQQALLVPILYDSQAQIARCRADVMAGLEQLEQEIDRCNMDSNCLISPADWLAAIAQHTNFSLSYQGYDDRPLQSQYGRLIRHLVWVVYPQWAEMASPQTSQASQSSQVSQASQASTTTQTSPDRSPQTPNLQRSRQESQQPERIKIGYISSSLGPSRLGELTIGWIEHHNRQQFEIIGYYTQATCDALTNRFRQACDQFRHYPDRDLETIAQTLRDDQLDLLIFTDLGIDPLLGVLAAMRLAPVQCTTWSHPITTGLETIDYFLSSATMETETSDRHYSETLVRLADIGIVVPPVTLPTVGTTIPSQSLGEDAVDESNAPNTPELSESSEPAEPYEPSEPSELESEPETSGSSPPAKMVEIAALRQRFGLAIDQTLLLCCQSLFKYLPQDDEIWVEIATGVPTAQLVFIAHPSPQLTEKFRLRLEQAFAKRGLEFAQRAIILPRLSEVDYLRVNQCCDVFLDSFHWSGGVTTLKAIACGLPIVTCPGELMRSRHSFGILQTLGITETIATTPAEYIAIAVRLAQDANWRQDLRQRAIAQHDRLFNNTTCLQELEAFVIRVTGTDHSQFNKNETN